MTETEFNSYKDFLKTVDRAKRDKLMNILRDDYIHNHYIHKLTNVYLARNEVYV